MAAQKKIKKTSGKPDDLETSVAQALFELETNVAELKADLKDLYISAAKEVDVAGGKKAVVIFVPFKLLKNFRKIQGRLVRELEKKFSGKHVVLVGQRKIVPKYSRRPGAGAKPRARKYTLTAVHDAILEDLVFPSEVVGRRTRVKLDGQVLKIVLDKKEKEHVEHKLDTFSTVYKKLTGKTVTFEFPASNE